MNAIVAKQCPSPHSFCFHYW